MPKGKKATIVDRGLLESAVKEAEKNGPLPTRVKLFEDVTKIYNAKASSQITFSVAGLRIKEWGLPLVTPLGKRGRHGPMTPEHKAAMHSARKTRVSKAEKFSSDPASQKSFVELRKRTPVALQVLCNRIEKGSRNAAIRLMCIACMGHENYHTEIRDCTTNWCPLYVFRPYKPGVDEIEAEED